MKTELSKSQAEADEPANHSVSFQAIRWLMTSIIQF